MTNAETSYFAWYLDRNGLSATDHSVHKIPYVAGYDAATADLKAKFIAMIESASVVDPSLKIMIDGVNEL